MSVQQESILGLYYGWASPEVWNTQMDQNILTLASCVQLAVISVENTPPGPTPDDGDRYLVGASPTGAWAGHAHKIATWQSGGWLLLTPMVGWRCDVNAPTPTELRYTLAGWGSVPTAGETNTASNFGATGYGLYRSKSGADLQFKKLIPGSNVTITDDGNALTIASTGGGGGGVANIGDVIDAILTDGDDILMNDEGSVLYEITAV